MMPSSLHACPRACCNITNRSIQSRGDHIHYPVHSLLVFILALCTRCATIAVLRARRLAITNAMVWFQTHTDSVRYLDDDLYFDHENETRLFK